MNNAAILSDEQAASVLKIMEQQKVDVYFLANHHLSRLYSDRGTYARITGIAELLCVTYSEAIAACTILTTCNNKFKMMIHTYDGEELICVTEFSKGFPDIALTLENPRFEVFLAS